MTKPRLFHVSEVAGIARFEPRPNHRIPGEMVWAVDEPHLPNFLVPRDCPRITFGLGPRTTAEDAQRFLVGAGRVVAFEAEWLERVRSGVLHIYELPSASFQPQLPEAGYWISTEAVRPIRSWVENDILRALADAGVEVRVLQDFWPLRDAVVTSSLEFSVIHTEAAKPRRLEP